MEGFTSSQTCKWVHLMYTATQGYKYKRCQEKQRSRCDRMGTRVALCLSFPFTLSKSGSLLRRGDRTVFRRDRTMLGQLDNLV